MVNQNPRISQPFLWWKILVATCHDRIGPLSSGRFPSWIISFWFFKNFAKDVEVAEFVLVVVNCELRIWKTFSVSVDLSLKHQGHFFWRVAFKATAQGSQN